MGRDEIQQMQKKRDDEKQKKRRKLEIRKRVSRKLCVSVCM